MSTALAVLFLVVLLLVALRFAPRLYDAALHFLLLTTRLAFLVLAVVVCTLIFYAARS